jgi:hypothetical protein
MEAKSKPAELARLALTLHRNNVEQLALGSRQMLGSEPSTAHYGVLIIKGVMLS